MQTREMGIIAVSLALVTACGDVSAGRVSAAVVRDSLGISIVENTAPMWAPAEGWRLSEEPVLTIGMLDGPEAYQLDGVRGAVRLADGTLVIANGGSQQLRFYDADGRHIRDAGRQGGGPGEFQSLMALFRLRGDTVAAWDWREKRLTTFTSGGELVGAQQIDALPGMAALVRGVLDDGSLIATPGPDPAALLTMSAGERRDTMVLLRYSPEGSLLDTIARVPAAEMVVDRSGGGFMMQPVLFGPSGYVSVGGGYIHAGSSDTFQLIALEPDGSLSRITRRAHEARPVTPAIVADVRAAQAEARAGGGMQIVVGTSSGGAAPSLPQPQDAPYRDVMPAFDRIIADRAGNLWVRNYEPTGYQDDRIWSVFDSEGHLLGDVHTPAGLDVTEFGEDYILGVWKDEFDVEYVRMYTLNRS